MERLEKWFLGEDVNIPTHRLKVWSEPAGEVELRAGGDDTDDGHHADQAEYQVHSDEGLVDGPALLLRVVPGDEVPEAHRGEGDEAVVEGVEEGPDRLHEVEQEGGEEDEEEEDKAGDQGEVKTSDFERRVKVTQSGVEDVQQEVDGLHQLTHEDTQQEEREGDPNEGVDHAEHFSC